MEAYIPVTRDEAYMLPAYLRIAALTYNMANQAIEKSIANQIAEHLSITKHLPDVVLLGLQEANSGQQGHLGNYLTLINSDYEVLYSHSVKTVTKPGESAELQQIVLIKKGVPVSIDYAKSGDTVSALNNKGGLFTCLNVGKERLAFVNLHLDSFRHGKRKAQFDDIKHQILNDEDITHRVVLGDFNERLDKFTTATHAKTNIAAAMLKHDSLHKAPYLQGTGLQFAILEKTTYCKLKDGEISYNQKRGQLDAGGLDNIGVQGDFIRNTTTNKSTVLDNLKQSGKQCLFSDHHAVMQNMTMCYKPLEEKDQLIAKLKSYCDSQRYHSHRPISKWRLSSAHTRSASRLYNSIFFDGSKRIQQANAIIQFLIKDTSLPDELQPPHNSIPKNSRLHTLISEAIKLKQEEAAIKAIKEASQLPRRSIG